MLIINSGLVDLSMSDPPLYVYLFLHNNSPGNSHLLLFLLFMQMSSAWETKGSVYNGQCNFSASNVVKKSAHYTRVNTVFLTSSRFLKMRIIKIIEVAEVDGVNINSF